MLRPAVICLALVGGLSSSCSQQAPPNPSGSVASASAATSPGSLNQGTLVVQRSDSGSLNARIVGDIGRSSDGCWTIAVPGNPAPSLVGWPKGTAAHDSGGLILPNGVKLSEGMHITALGGMVSISNKGEGLDVVDRLGCLQNKAFSQVVMVSELQVTSHSR